jgi:hypothetical protein
MSETLIPLKTLDLASELAKVKSLKSQANGYAKFGSTLPGIPDLKAVAKKILDAEKDEIIDKARLILIPVLIAAMAVGVTKLAELIPEINKMIKALNKIITAMGVAGKLLISAATKVFIVILALVITVVITTIIIHIPSLVVAWGAGVSFDVPKGIAGVVLKSADNLLGDMMPIAFKIISVIIMILSLYRLMLMIMGMLKMFMQGQIDSAATADDAFNKTADDWSDTVGGDDDGDGDGYGGGDGSGGGDLVECTLPDGTKAQMTPEECLAAGGTFGEMELLNQLNDLDKQINNLNDMIENATSGGDGGGDGDDGGGLISCTLPNGEVAQMTPEECLAAGGVAGAGLISCTLPNGEVAQMTPEECLAAGGTFGTGTGINPNLCWSECQHGLDLDGTKIVTCQLPDGTNEDITLAQCNERNGIDSSIANLMRLLSDLRDERDSICVQLGNNCDFQLGEFTITSLKNPQDDITIKTATYWSGMRRGFYSSETGTGFPIEGDDTSMQPPIEDDIDVEENPLIVSMSYSMENLSGCTDPSAINYNPTATTNDGSCEFAEEE